MDSYFKSVIKFLHFLGYDISNKYQSKLPIRIVFLIYKIFVFVLLLLVVIQSFLNALLKGFKTFDDFKSYATAMFGMRGLLMNIFLMKNFNGILGLIKRMKRLNTNKEHDKNHDLFKKAKVFGKTIFVVNMLSVGSYYFGGYIEVIMCIFTKEIPRKEMVFSVEIFWPFDPTDYLPWTLFWFSFALHYWQWSCGLMNFIVLYITVYITGLYNNLQADLTEIINGCDKRPASETQKMFRNFIKAHNKTTCCAEELRSLAGFPIIVFIGEASFMVCFLSFSIIASYFIFEHFKILKINELLVFLGCRCCDDGIRFCCFD